MRKVGNCAERMPVMRLVRRYGITDLIDPKIWLNRYSVRIIHALFFTGVRMSTVQNLEG